VLEISETELIHSLNYNAEKLFSVIDTYDSRISPIKKKDPEKYNEIMVQVYKNTHKSTLSGGRLNEWINNFPNMIDRKIETEKRKLKEKLKSPKKVKASKRVYITSPLRNRNILDKMAKLGYYSINTKSKTEKMKAGLEDDEIIADLVEEISDPRGGDHDMVEINYDKQFKDHLEAYKERYKYVYAVEDIKPEKKDVLIRKDVVSVPIKPKEKVELKKKRPVKITLVKKPTKKKVKLFSSVIFSENPIKITPVEELEHIKKKPVVRKKPLKKAPTKKKKPPVKKKPIVKKKTIKKVAIPKKKPIVRKKATKKKKPLPKVKSMRAKRRNSPITGRWTARYRMIGGKKKKVLIRRRKGNIQTRIIS